MTDRMRDALDPEVVHPVQPYQATKVYICPGCEGAIEAGVYHVVVVPEFEPDLRRHWHHGCWYKETRRRGSFTSRRSGST